MECDAPLVAKILRGIQAPSSPPLDSNSFFPSFRDDVHLVVCRSPCVLVDVAAACVVVLGPSSRPRHPRSSRLFFVSPSLRRKTRTLWEGVRGYETRTRLPFPNASRFRTPRRRGMKARRAGRLLWYC
jgi:hypothetical protein